MIKTNFINLNEAKSGQIDFKEKGKYLVFFHNLSGRFIFEIIASGVELYIFGLFTGKGDDQFRIETIQRHIAPRSTSNLLIKGVFEDRAKLIYQGLIRIEKSGQKSHAYQKNQNLLLSDGAFVESRPFLEILANDVYCTHGSTTGRLNQDQLLYIQSRGLNSDKAEKLLVTGFIAEIHDRVRAQYPDFQPSAL
ncbi:hypothetical protein A3F03_04245 [Candidatus Roizmanbacteria bacterium RIFCSPHIGHO2_12_FULL_41_11]|uniref:SUF system FeS cluster assembly SufBD core domain-containing protein n=3 Tax=Candidatus Roizmaniibacteriota TaxID=1752723 RepID=A0A1F7JS41_9BACT|nr:MAG: hypothetical protein A3F03_04245 [Candidatus Roizmanbacteria bacterium RIFCSPHIGHO2_12_FULL_41_11]OGK52793.1 MAG: hypothetical protein A2966_04785 [Candidatus Roizmanbacteria bacterium RIFCSPLOWO2_01_FULL_41_22]OGK58416.1 MAG: hypothetical protein A3H86_03545 [Candidatus Roizmanbacteria bacterium RIFCSPLOWO2_02_FULL_41_9]